MIKLYQYTQCPFCEKVRQKLAALGLEYEKVEVDPANKPKIVTDLGKTVPVIEDGDVVMNESGKIVEYLQKKYGKNS